MKTCVWNEVEEKNIYGFSDVKSKYDGELYTKRCKELHTAIEMLDEMVVACQVERDFATADQISDVLRLVEGEYKRFRSGEAEAIMAFMFPNNQ